MKVIPSQIVLTVRVTPDTYGDRESFIESTEALCDEIEKFLSDEKGIDCEVSWEHSED